MTKEEELQIDRQLIKEGLENNSWCNCSNFPFQKCDECKIIFYNYENTIIK
jgi:hypothetical protein